MISDTSWRIDKRIPVTLLAAIFFQTIGVVIWGAHLDGRVSYLENTSVNSEKFAHMEEKMNQVQASNAEMKTNVSVLNQGIGGMKQELGDLKEEIRKSSFGGRR